MANINDSEKIFADKYDFEDVFSSIAILQTRHVRIIITAQPNSFNQTIKTNKSDNTI